VSEHWPKATICYTKKSQLSDKVSIAFSGSDRSSLRDLLLQLLVMAKAKVAEITDCHRRWQNPSNPCQNLSMASDCSISQDSTAISITSQR